MSQVLCGRYTIDSSRDGFYRIRVCESVADVQKSGGSGPSLECLDMPFLVTELRNITCDGQSSALALPAPTGWRVAQTVRRAGAIYKGSADTLEVPAVCD